MLKTVLGFDYEKVLQFGRLKIDELFLLNWFMLFYPDMSKKKIGGLDFGWVRYGYVKKLYGCLGLSSPRIVHDKFAKLVEKGFLLHETVREGGVFSYFCPSALTKAMWKGDELKKEGKEKEKQSQKSKLSAIFSRLQG